MRTRTPLPENELGVRIDATSPDQDAWVSANAGSGKTRILRNRVIRLLLDGTAPDRILCLTYTRAAAAEMQTRIFEELSRWVTLSDAQLDEAIGELVAIRPKDHRASAHERERARTLFARAIEAPGGLKVQTIHAFAERVLHLFPVEAGVPLGFSILLDDEAQAMRRAARRGAIEDAVRAPASTLGKAFGEVLAATSPKGFEKALAEMLQVLARLRLNNERCAGDDALGAAYAQVLGVGAGDTLEKAARALALGVPPEALEEAASALESRPKASDAQKRQAGAMRAAAQTLRGGAGELEDVLGIFLTGENQPRAGTIFPKDLAGARPDLVAFDMEAKAACMAYIERRAALQTLVRSHAMAIFASDVAARYARAKQARALLDFDDLILALRRLLSEGRADWVMLKLDGGIDHILIDEAQDTSRAMWEIIAALSAEFSAGQGARNATRTLFAVGDEKQSIYSFQGAEPAVFEEYRQVFARRSLRGGMLRNPVRLNYSFRSSQDVLDAVDAAFAPQDNRAGLSAGEAAPAHIAADKGFAGHVELWPPARPRAKGDEAGHVALAREIAAQIAGWLAVPERHLVDGKPVRPGDILVLVPKRDGFYGALRHALKRAGVPLAGADRLTLQKDLAVQDLLSLAQALLVPEDDLALAEVLKSPLFGISEAALEALARGRAGSLRAALAEAPGAPGAFAQWLEAQADRAARLSPFAFFAGALSGPAPMEPARSLRAVLAAQLGPEIADPLNAFLNEALAHGKDQPGALLPFLLAQQRRESELKRDAGEAEDKVRVMTVHGAKGLEARIVFLAGAHDLPDKRQEPSVQVLRDSRGHALPVWSALARKDEAGAVRLERARRRALLMGEYRRLLYVGMTRAADRLYVVSHARLVTKDEVKAGEELPDPPEALEASWYQMLRRALSSAEPFGEAEVLQPGLPPRAKRRLLSTQASAPPQPPGPAPAPPPPLPEWALRALKPEAREVFLAPSRSAAPVGAVSGGDPGARQRGIVLHKLFEHLPRVDAVQRPQAGARLIRLLSPGASAQDEAALLAPVLALLEGPLGVRFFGAESRAEVSVSGVVTLPGGHGAPVRGRIDRLVIAPERVDILDLKTGRARDAAAAAGYVQQLALYRALLAPLYPQHAISCHILWLEDARLETLGEAVLDAALLALAAAQKE